MKLSGPSRIWVPYATSYNLTLNRRCTEAATRYLVLNNVPLKNMSLLALGKKDTSRLLEPTWKFSVPTSASKQELRGLARRVRIRLYARAPHDRSK